MSHKKLPSKVPSLASGLVRRKPEPFALEQRFVFDGVGIFADVQEARPEPQRGLDLALVDSIQFEAGWLRPASNFVVANTKGLSDPVAHVLT